MQKKSYLVILGQNSFTLFLSSCYLPLNYPCPIVTVVIINILLYCPICCPNNITNTTSFSLTML